MVLFELFLSFLKIGFTCFGGATMVPLVQAEMVSHGWMTLAEVADIVAIAEMTPGPLGTNCATFAGTRVAGVIGAAIANLGVLMPTFTLAVAVGYFLDRFRNNRLLDEALSGIRPASIGMVLTVILTMSLSSYGNFGGMPIADVLGRIAGALPVMLIPLVLSLAAGWMIENISRDQICPAAGSGRAFALSALILVSLAALLSCGLIAWQSLVIGAVALLLLMRFHRSVPTVMLVSGALGVLLGTLFP